MEPFYQSEGVTLYQGGNRWVLPTLPQAAAVVTDPPYELGFMGREWDKSGVAFDPDTWRVVLDRVKPGGYLLAFAGARTQHRIGVAIEDAGFEIRDTLQWLYGQGYPKGRTQLKPGYEPIILARRPGLNTELRIDAARIPPPEGDHFADQWDRPVSSNLSAPGGALVASASQQWVNLSAYKPTGGRWPANVILSHSPDCVPVGVERVKGGNKGIHGTMGGGRSGGIMGSKRQRQYDFEGYADPDGRETVERWQCAGICPVAEVDRQSGISVSSGKLQPGGQLRYSRRTYAQDATSQAYRRTPYQGPGDRGGASRFYYVAKASRAERGPGNDWPTVKPLALMRYLVRLVAAPGELVIDPFAGSGTTLIAAGAEGCPVIGIDLSARACQIAVDRLRAAEIQTAANLTDPKIDQI